VGDEIFNLMKVAREDGDYASEQFIQWFVKEQVEEVASMTSLHDVVERAKDQPLLAEDYLAREGGGGGGGTDPTAPAVAGGSL
jgi:ferritin